MLDALGIEIVADTDSIEAEAPRRKTISQPEEQAAEDRERTESEDQDDESGEPRVVTDAELAEMAEGLAKIIEF